MFHKDSPKLKDSTTRIAKSRFIKTYFHKYAFMAILSLFDYTGLYKVIANHIIPKIKEK